MKVLITQSKPTFWYEHNVGDIFEVYDVGADDVWHESPMKGIGKQDCHIIQPAWQVMEEAEETGRSVDIWNKNKKEWQCKGKQYGWFVDEIYRISPEPPEPPKPVYSYEADKDKLRGVWVRHVSGDYEAQVVYLSKDLIGIYEGSFNWTQFFEFHSIINEA